MQVQSIQNQITESISMFAFLAIELTLLFLIISYIVGVIQQFIPEEKIQTVLGSKNGKGYFVSAILGSITPFCSCSTIPFLKGLLRANAGFGPTMVFLIASPLLNPIIIGLFIVTFGWEITLFYFVVSLGVSVVSGVLLKHLGFERDVRQLKEEKSTCSTGCESNDNAKIEHKLRWVVPWKSALKDYKNVFPYLLFGIAIGSMIYGFVPTEFIAKHTAADKLLAVPISAVIGVPLYVRAEAVIPLSAALVSKGMSLGAAMALIIGSAGASITEVILLRSLFKTRIIIAFLIIILSMAIISGYTLNFFILT